MKKLKITLEILLFLIVLFGLSVFVIFLDYLRAFPIPEKFTERYLPQSTKIYDRTGEVLLYEIFGEEKRTVVPLSEIPDCLKNAVLAAEDADFYKHGAVDWKAILRAVLVDLKLEKPIQGGSTISQQLIRSTFLTNQKTFQRKTREIVATFLLEKKYSKDQIFEFYLNQIPFGSNAYGVESASETFFGKKVQDISLPEAATLAALIRAPSALSPYGPKKEELLKRKDYILDRMAQEGFITQDEAEEAKREQVSFQENKNILRAPYFTLYVKTLLEEKFGLGFLKTAGFKVITTLDWNFEQETEKILKEQVEKNKKMRAFNGAAVVLDPKTGEVLSLVGSADWFASSYPQGCKEGENCLFEPRFNIVVYGKRQPGSAFKPFAYATAFQKGFTPNTILWDVKTNFSTTEKPYIPHNYDYRFRGPINLKNSLAQSINVTSVKTLYLAGIDKTMALAKKMGITTLNNPPEFYGLPLVLGGGEVNLLEMTSAYGVFATDGFKTNPYFIKEILDSKGNIILQKKSTPKKILDSNICREINDILSDNKARAPVFGWQSPLYFKDYQVAVKTGTTQNFNDAWTIGYTPFIVVGVWVGNNDNSPMEGPGVTLAGPIFHKIMEQILTKHPKEKFAPPIIPKTGKPILDGVLPSPPHSILYYVDKDNPLGPNPLHPEKDPQFSNWEGGVQGWVKENSSNK